MASQFPPDDRSYEALSERSTRYWQKAQEMFHRACNAQTKESKALYMEVAKAWATIAAELERPPPMPQDGHDQPAKKH